jgi:very-short-patch-repair endonuclease
MDVEARIARIARAQHGAITARQLHAVGLTASAIRSRVTRGRLIRVFHGVYATADPRLLPLVHHAGALLALGTGAVISHRSAAALWRVAQPEPRIVEVTLIGRDSRRTSGIRIHRTRRLDARDTVKRAGLPVTSFARTLIDFAPQATAGELEHAFAEGRAKRLISDHGLQASLGRAHPNHPGAAIIRELLSGKREGGYERSRAERLMRRHVRAADLPLPLVNVMLHGHLVDFLWPEAKLIVEVDGYGSHGHRLAFEADRRRDQVHAAAGYLVIRITWRQLTQEPLAVIARIAQALARRMT